MTPEKAALLERLTCEQYTPSPSWKPARETNAEPRNNLGPTAQAEIHLAHREADVVELGGAA